MKNIKMISIILDLRKTSSRSELASDELKPILSGGEVPVGTLTTEKLVLAGRNSSDEAGILRKSSILLVVVFIAPALGAFISTIGQNAETNQYAGIQWAVMGVYNLPFFIVSLVTLLVGGNYYKKQKVKTASVLFSLSIITSLIGTILMLLWGLGVVT